MYAGVLGFLSLGLGHVASVAGGIPEPDLVMYGVVRDTTGGLNVRVTSGELVWTFQPSGGGASITVTTTLKNINDQFSYVLRVPCETEVPGITPSAGVLKLGATWNRQRVEVAGVEAAFLETSQHVLTLAERDRGRIERVDLVVSLGLPGLLPEAWQMQYFGHTQVDPFDDPDQDGVDNLNEYRAGTHPLDAKSLFEVHISKDALGGPRLQWLSAAGKLYIIHRSEDLTTGFEILATGVPATPPTNSYRDETVAGGIYFYRVSLDPDAP